MFNDIYIVVFYDTYRFDIYVHWTVRWQKNSYVSMFPVVTPSSTKRTALRVTIGASHVCILDMIHSCILYFMIHIQVIISA